MKTTLILLIIFWIAEYGNSFIRPIWKSSSYAPCKYCQTTLHMKKMRGGRGLTPPKQRGRSTPKVDVPLIDPAKLLKKPAELMVERSLTKEKRLPLESFSLGQKYTGRIISVVKHGFFVDIGTIKDGLVHIKDISNKFFESSMLNYKYGPGQDITVWVKYIDYEQKNFGLQMYPPTLAEFPSALKDLTIAATHALPEISYSWKNLTVGQEVIGRVIRATNFGMFVNIQAPVTAFINRVKIKSNRKQRKLTAEELIPVFSIHPFYIYKLDIVRQRIELTSYPPDKWDHVFSHELYDYTFLFQQADKHLPKSTNAPLKTEEDELLAMEERQAKSLPPHKRKALLGKQSLVEAVLGKRRKFGVVDPAQEYIGFDGVESTLNEEQVKANDEAMERMLALSDGDDDDGEEVEVEEEEVEVETDDDHDEANNIEIDDEYEEDDDDDDDDGGETIEEDMYSIDKQKKFSIDPESETKRERHGRENDEYLKLNSYWKKLRIMDKYVRQKTAANDFDFSDAKKYLAEQEKNGPTRKQIIDDFAQQSVVNDPQITDNRVVDASFTAEISGENNRTEEDVLSTETKENMEGSENIESFAETVRKLSANSGNKSFERLFPFTAALKHAGLPVPSDPLTFLLQRPVSQIEIQSTQRTDKELFESLCRRRSYLTFQTLKKWSYIRENINFGFINLEQVRTVFLQAGARFGKLTETKFPIFKRLLVEAMIHGGSLPLPTVETVDPFNKTVQVPVHGVESLLPYLMDEKPKKRKKVARDSKPSLSYHHLDETNDNEEGEDTDKTQSIANKITQKNPQILSSALKKSTLGVTSVSSIAEKNKSYLKLLFQKVITKTNKAYLTSERLFANWNEMFYPEMLSLSPFSAMDRLDLSPVEMKEAVMFYHKVMKNRKFMYFPQFLGFFKHVMQRLMDRNAELIGLTPPSSIKAMLSVDKNFGTPQLKSKGKFGSLRTDNNENSADVEDYEKLAQEDNVFVSKLRGVDENEEISEIVEDEADTVDDYEESSSEEEDNDDDVDVDNDDDYEEDDDNEDNDNEDDEVDDSPDVNDDIVQNQSTIVLDDFAAEASEPEPVKSAVATPVVQESSSKLVQNQSTTVLDDSAAEASETVKSVVATPVMQESSSKLVQNQSTTVLDDFAAEASEPEPVKSVVATPEESPSKLVQNQPTIILGNSAAEASEPVKLVVATPVVQESSSELSIGFDKQPMSKDENLTMELKEVDVARNESNGRETIVTQPTSPIGFNFPVFNRKIFERIENNSTTDISKNEKSVDSSSHSQEEPQELSPEETEKMLNERVERRFNLLLSTSQILHGDGHTENESTVNRTLSFVELLEWGFVRELIGDGILTEATLTEIALSAMKIKASEIKSSNKKKFIQLTKAQFRDLFIRLAKLAHVVRTQALQKNQKTPKTPKTPDALTTFVQEHKEEFNEVNREVNKEGKEEKDDEEENDHEGEEESEFELDSTVTFKALAKGREYIPIEDLRNWEFLDYLKKEKLISQQDINRTIASILPEKKGRFQFEDFDVFLKEILLFSGFISPDSVENIRVI